MLVAGHSPDGTSMKVIAHMAQMVAAGQMQHYDHGKEKNLKKHGQEKPPVAPIDNW